MRHLNCYHCVLTSESRPLIFVLALRFVRAGAPAFTLLHNGWCNVEERGKRRAVATEDLQWYRSVGRTRT